GAVGADVVAEDRVDPRGVHDVDASPGVGCDNVPAAGEPVADVVVARVVDLNPVTGVRERRRAGDVRADVIAEHQVPLELSAGRGGQGHTVTGIARGGIPR